MEGTGRWKQLRGKELFISVATAGTTMLLCGGTVGGLYGPWALAAVACCGGKGRGFWAAAGTLAGAYLFYDFQSGLRLAASAVLIYCANMAFSGMKIAAHPLFTPLLTATAHLLVQSVYLVGRTVQHWSLCFMAAAVAAAAAALLRREEEGSGCTVLCILTALVSALSPLLIDGFSPGRTVAVWLVLLCSTSASPALAAVIGAGVGLVSDLSFSAPALLLCTALGIGGGAAALLQKRSRLLMGGAVLLCVAAVGFGLDSDHAPAMLYEALCGMVAYVVVPRRWICEAPAHHREKADGEREDTAAAVPAMARTALREGAAAYRALYDELRRDLPRPAVENPSVIFDHAAEKVCSDCVLAQRCWQTEYDVTYSAFNDAVGPMLRRGRPEASDFPLHFASRCVRFPQLLSAVDRGVYAYLLRRQYRLRLGSVRSLVHEQYAQMGETLSAPPATEGEVRFFCRAGSALRAKEGERFCGDQLAVFTAGKMLYMLLSDGMGSGEEAHAESAMTVRLLRKFLKAGIEARAALKTLNTALTLRCAEGGGFTTIDLLALDRSSGEAVLYKYGAAPSCLRRDGGVTQLSAGSLPAGLQSSDTEPESSRVQLKEGDLFVMVSDGITGGDDKPWLPALLQQWQETDAQDLAQQILAESRRHGGLQDDCAALVLYLEKSAVSDKKRV